MEEEWHEIEGFNCRYFVSNLGRVKSAANFLHSDSIILKLGQYKNGYKVANLTCPNHRQKVFNVHRLVAEAFNPNPKNLEEVNHIDGDKTNNTVTNLEWVSRGYNAYHSREILHKNKGCCKEKAVRCIETREIFPSTKIAARSIGRVQQGVSAAARADDPRKTCGGYHWEYVL